MSQEQQLQAIRERWSGARWEDWYSSDWDEQSQNDGILRYAPTDIVALLRMISERDAIIHDLQLDGSALARRAVEEFIVKAMDWVKDQCEQHNRSLASHTGAGGWESSAYPSSPELGGILRWLQEELVQSCPATDPLPPDQARAEAERLRAKLRTVVEHIDSELERSDSWVLDAVLGDLKQIATKEIS